MNLFAVQQMSAETYCEAKRILSETFTPLYAFQALERPTKQRLDITVFMLVRNMHKTTQQDFKKLLGESVKTPTLDRVRKFLQSQASIYESMERSSPNSTTTTVASKKTFNTTLQASVAPLTKDADKSKNRNPKKSTLCNGVHFISKCSKLLEKSLIEKQSFIKEKTLCPIVWVHTLLMLVNQNSNAQSARVLITPCSMITIVLNLNYLQGCKRQFKKPITISLVKVFFQIESSVVNLITLRAHICNLNFCNCWVQLHFKDLQNIVVLKVVFC